MEDRGGRTCKLVLEDKDKDFPRGQQHWVTVKNGLLADISVSNIWHQKTFFTVSLCMVVVREFMDVTWSYITDSLQYAKSLKILGLCGPRTRTCKLVLEDSRGLQHCIYLYSAPSWEAHLWSAQVWVTVFILQTQHTCLHLVSVHQTAPPLTSNNTNTCLH